MDSHPGEGGAINSYALVSYIPGTLGAHLDRIRRVLVAGCAAQSHLTVLPPRPLENGGNGISAELAGLLRNFRPFRVVLEQVEVFETTSVIYLSVGEGADRLKEIHGSLNRGLFQGEEAFPYHPHVTLAQDFDSRRLDSLVDLARTGWGEFFGSREFEVDRLTFVQNTVLNRWMDLAEFALDAFRP